jgi:multidrug resistance efflux pump
MSAVKSLVLLCLALSLAGCGAIQNPTPVAQPTVILDDSAAPQAAAQSPSAAAGGVVASGSVVPAQQAQLAFALSGKVESVEAEVGEPVEAGQLLIRLTGSQKLAASIEAAKLELLTAQQALDQLYKELPYDQNAALQAVTDARLEVRDAERQLRSLNAPAEEIDIEAAWAAVVLARKTLDDARDDYAPYDNKPEDNLVRASLLNKLAEAQKLYDNAVQRYNRLAGISGSDFDRAQAEAKLKIAQARLELALQENEKVQAGPHPDRIALAEARIRNAEAQLAASESALADLELRAPFGGSLAAVIPGAGEWVLAGQPVISLADLSALQVDTSDLSEMDAPNIQIGQEAAVFIEALETTAPARVIAISPLADMLGGDVVYKVTLALEETPTGLRAGMSVEVEFAAGE